MGVGMVRGISGISITSCAQATSYLLHLLRLILLPLSSPASISQRSSFPFFSRVGPGALMGTPVCVGGGGRGKVVYSDMSRE